MEYGNQITMNSVRDRAVGGVTSACAPLCYTGLFLLLMLIWRMAELPSPDEVYARIVGLFDSYGVVVVAGAALVEGLVLISLYFPGSAVILIGVAASRGDPIRAMVVVGVVIVAFVVAAHLNYALGYWGFYELIRKLGGRKLLDRAVRRYEKYGALILPPCYMHPNLGGFMAVASGIGRLRWRRFTMITIASITVWNVFWGVFAYYFAEVVESVATQPWLVVAGLGCWSLCAFVWGVARGRRSDHARHSEQAVQ